jgi:ankyrin repeat protein
VKIFHKLKANEKSLLASAKQQDFSIDFVDAGGLTPLHYACQNNRL